MVYREIERVYSPEAQLMRTLVAQCEDDWGHPEDNREMLLPFGIRPLDLALYGMDMTNGELLLIQGPEKQRKSTLVANIVANYMDSSSKPADKPLTVIDSLESGMTPKRYRDVFISIVATKLLLAWGHTHKQTCPVCKMGICKELGISPEFLRYNTRTEVQAKAILEAMVIVQEWPLMIFGANDKEGDTRSLLKSITGDLSVESRWRHLIHQYGAKVFVTDHLQQYSFFESLSDYEKQLRTVAAVSDVVSQEKVVALVISQVSLTSQREANTGGKYYASGGKKAAAEATSIISVNYASGSGEVCITLEDSRKSKSFSIYQPLEDVSGCFYGESRVGQKAQYRPGMDEADVYNGKGGSKGK